MSAKRIKQQGAILLIMLVIMVIGIATVLISSMSSSSVKSSRQATTSAVLAQAKVALIGRAISDDTIPGSLPCPDTNDDGSAELFSGNDCPNYIGRLPWRTLQLPDLRDGNGERLWYALSPAFRDDNSAWPVNSNTKGTLLVYGPDGTTLRTQAGYSAVAVIFSAGSPVGSQNRGTVAEQNDPANYLDSANSRNNATAGGPFIAGAESATFNDQLLYITTKELIPQVEKRVAAELKKALGNYKSANGKYPWADIITSSASYGSNYGLNWGWLPDNAYVGSSTPDWSGSARPPQWFFDNQWYAVIFYSVAREKTAYKTDCVTNGNGVSNSGCVYNYLYLDGVSGVEALFIMPGTPIGTLTRSIDTLSDYLDDPQNNPQLSAFHTADHFITPLSQAVDRDRIYTLP
jgi:type II secretory pathway pseudopilin PulG